MKASNWLLNSMVLAIMLASGDASAARRDRDDNPPGPIGGRGSNWENPPGWRGGPGASPDHRFYLSGGHRYRFVAVSNGYHFHPVQGYWHPQYGFWNQTRHCWRDADDNPPGPRGGRGTNWENPPGPAGGRGASPDRVGRCR